CAERRTATLFDWREVQFHAVLTGRLGAHCEPSFRPGWQVNANIEPCHAAAIFRAAEDPGVAVAAYGGTRGTHPVTVRARIAQLRTRHGLDPFHGHRRIATGVANRLCQSRDLRTPRLHGC